MRSLLCKRTLGLASQCNNAALSTSVVTKEKKNDSFFGSFFERKIEVQKASHSARLAPQREQIIELQTHNVKPDSRQKYLDAHRGLCEYLSDKEKNLHCESIGSFRVFVGDEDQYIHLWRYDDGYHGIDETMAKLRRDQDYQKLRKEIVPLLRSRHSQYMLPFSFWPNVSK